MAGRLPSDWKLLTINECMAAIIDYRGKSPAKTHEGVPLITAKVVKGGRILAPTEFIAIGNYDGWMRRGMPQPGDVVITTEAPLGEVAQLDGSRVALAQRLIALRGKPEFLDNTFLRFALQDISVQSQLRARATGTTVLGISQNELRKVELPIPPLTEQREIAEILGALDAKIEINERICSTLETICRTIFKSWFIDFDQERSAAPNAFQSSSLGQIPMNWEASTVGLAFNLTMGQSPPGETYNENGDGVPFFQGRTDFGFRYPSNRVFCTAPTRYANPGDTLVSVRAPVGDINMAATRCAIGRGVAAVRHKSGSRSYTYYALASLRENLSQFESEGTVFGAINKDAFLQMKCLVPPPDLVAKFEKVAYPMDESIQNCSEQTATLQALRDTLLPKLISGELRLNVDKTEAYA